MQISDYKQTRLRFLIEKLYFGSVYRTTHMVTCSFSSCSVTFQRCYLLGKGGYVFGSVGLSVCLSVNNITQKVMDGLG